MRSIPKYLFVLTALIFQLSVQSQVATGYNFSQVNGSYTAVSGGTLLGSTASDDELFVTGTGGNASPQTGAGFAIGFTFHFNGSPFTQFGVSTNGYIMLGNLPSFTMPLNGCNCFGNAASGTVNVDNGIALFANSNLISALNYDLIGQTGSTLQFTTTGSAPNRTLTVQWTGFTSYGLSDSYDFQIKLIETLDEIQLCYGSFSHDATFEDARVGLYGASNTDFFMRTSATSWTNTTNGATSGASIAFKNTSIPPSGLIFKYDPNPILPIELVSFDVVQYNENLRLSWITASENNNDFFTIEKSKDGENYSKLIDVKGSGQSSSRKEYFETDYQPYPGVSYYRLKQTDMNGEAKYFPIVCVNFKESQSITLYPNPASDDEMNIKISGYANQEVLVVLHDMKGDEYFSRILISQNDNQLFAIDPQKKIAPGTYLMIATSNNKMSNQKIIIK